MVGEAKERTRDAGALGERVRTGYARPVPAGSNWPVVSDAGAGARLVARLGRARDDLVLAVRHEAEAGRGFLWLPVVFGLGILGYFALPREPAFSAVAGLFLVLLAATVATRGAGRGFHILLAATVFAGGLADAKWRTDRVAAPMLTARMDARLTGLVVDVEPGRRGGRRLTIAPRAIEGLTAERTPRLVTVVARTKAAIAPGDTVSIRAVLMPPPGPVQPGGADFRRMAFYEGRGATGFSLGQPEIVAATGPVTLTERFEASLAGARQVVAGRIRDVLDGAAAGIAVALITGERGGIPAKAEEALRVAGLAHVLAISGLHMALVAGTVFFVVRALLALVPRLALTRPIRKWAAVAALLTAAGYTALSGASVSTQRAFVMLAVMLIAVIADRRALSMRNVALAALFVLAVAPDSLLGPSFQMSFAAAMALIAAYETGSRRQQRRAGEPPAGAVGRAGRRVLRYGGGLFWTSLIAGSATGPIAAFHFHRIAVWGLLGNLLAMPVVGTMVMPGALLAMILMPFGLEVVGLKLMEAGIGIVLAAADWVAALPAAALVTPAMPSLAAGLIGLGLLVLSLLTTRLRLVGIALFALALAVPRDEPADLIVADSGRTAALRLEDGRLAILGGKSDRFAAEEWLRADGDGRPYAKARLAGKDHCADGVCRATGRGGVRVAIVTELDALRPACADADVVVTRFWGRRRCPDHPMLIDRDALERHGAHELVFRVVVAQGDGVDAAAAAAEAGAPAGPRAGEGDAAVAKSGPGGGARQSPLGEVAGDETDTREVDAQEAEGNDADTADTAAAAVGGAPGAWDRTTGRRLPAFVAELRVAEPRLRRPWHGPPRGEDRDGPRQGAGNRDRTGAGSAPAAGSVAGSAARPADPPPAEPGAR